MYYSDFNEKNSHFTGNDCIDNVEELNDFIKEHLKSKVYIFRGTKEAKYKLYTSAQRKWLCEKVSQNSNYSYLDFIKNLIGTFYTTNKQLMSKYFKCIGISVDDLNAMCYMQHYGAPTPMLDFTTDIRTALYFAMSEEKNDYTNDINDFFSIYLMLYKENTEDINHIARCRRERCEFSEIRLDYLEEQRVYFIDFLKSSKRAPSSFYCTPNNLNMVAQNGLLLIHKDSNKPIEEVLNNKIRCVNIHKSLIPYIESYLKSKGVTKERLFPQPEAIAKICTDSIYKNKIK